MDIYFVYYYLNLDTAHIIHDQYINYQSITIHNTLLLYASLMQQFV